MTTLVTLGPEWLQYVNLVASVLLPALVALVTARLAASWVKTLVLAFLAAVLTVLVAVADPGGFRPTEVVFLFVQNLMTAIVAHYGVLRNIGLSGRDSVFATHGYKGQHRRNDQVSRT